MAMRYSHYIKRVYSTFASILTERQRISIGTFSNLVVRQKQTLEEPLTPPKHDENATTKQVSPVSAKGTDSSNFFITNAAPNDPLVANSQGDSLPP